MKQKQWPDYGIRVQTDTNSQTTSHERYVSDMLRRLRSHPGNPNEEELELVNTREIVTSTQADADSSEIPVVLFIEQRHSDGKLDGLQDWYKQRKLEAETATVADECASLRNTLGSRLGKLEEKHSRRQRLIRALSPLMAKLHAGDQIIMITEAMALAPRDRPKRTPWKEAGYASFVHPSPDKKWRERLHHFRTAEWSTPLALCDQMINLPSINEGLAKAADEFVAELRDPSSPYLDYLGRYSDLHPGSRAELRETIRRGVELALLAPEARKALVEGELNALLRIILGADAPTATTQTDGPIAKALVGFDLNWLNPPDETPLAKKFAEDWTGDIADSLDGGSFITSILMQGAAHLVLEAKEAGVAGPDISAFLFRLAVAIGNLSREQQDSLIDALESFRETRDFQHVQSFLFDGKTGVLAPVAKISSIALHSVTVVTRLILFRLCVDAAIEADDGSNKQLVWLQTAGAVADLASAGAELAKSLADTALVARLAKSLNLNLAAIGPVAACASFAADFLTLLISAEEHAAAVKNKRTTKFREAKKYAAYYDAAKVVASSLALFFGWEAAVIGVAIMGLKHAATNLDSWVPHVPFSPTQKKPAPHKLLEQLLNDMVNEDKHGYRKVLREIGPLVGKELAAKLDQQVTLLLERLEIGVPVDAPLFWDLAPPPSDLEDRVHASERDRKNLHQVKQIIRLEWGGYDEATLDKLVQHSKY